MNSLVRIKKLPLFAEILCNHFEQLSALRPRYSMGAFAKSVGISKSFLSRIMRGQQIPSDPIAQKIVVRLKMREHQRQLFLAATAVKRARTPLARKRAAQIVERIQSGSLEFITDTPEHGWDWNDEVILELSRLHRPRADAESVFVKKISDAVGTAEAVLAARITHLKRAGLLVESNGYLSPLNHVRIRSLVEDKSTFEAPLRAGLGALHSGSHRQLAVSTLVIGVRRSKLPEAVEKIRAFVDQFAETFNTESANDEVVALNLQFFKVLDKPLAE